MFKTARLFVLALAVISEVAVLSGSAVAGASCPQVGFTVVEPHSSRETRAVKVGRHRVIYVRRVPITTTGDIVDIRLVSDDDGDGASLLIKFTPSADQRLHDATTNHAGMRLAFMFNDELLVDTVWEGPYGMDLGGTRVSMRHGMKRAQRLMHAIHGCTGVTAGYSTP